jgi:hypothetical protein
MKPIVEIDVVEEVNQIPQLSYSDQLFNFFQHVPLIPKLIFAIIILFYLLSKWIDYVSPPVISGTHIEYYSSIYLSFSVRQ